MTDAQNEILAHFHPAIRTWFGETFARPTPPQELGWPLIAQNKSTLILAPTGSGKTLAAFLVCINQILQLKIESKTDFLAGVHTLYISPLKALNYDIERNLEQPLQGIRDISQRLGLNVPEISTAVRTGDTPQREREHMRRHPPDILITTPESLHLLLTSQQARRMLESVRFVIVDEIHALSDNKRGVFLGLLLERLSRLNRQPLVRIGLSATQKPIAEIAKFLGGLAAIEVNGKIQYQGRPVEIVDSGMRKEMDLAIRCPVPDLRSLPEKSIWPRIYQELLHLIRSHKSTLIFANSRRNVERITSAVNELAGLELCRAHHGSVSRELRHQLETALKRGELPALVATASLELGIDMGAIDLVVQVESPRDIARALQRIGRAGHLYGVASKGRLLPKTRADLLEMAVIVRAMKQGDISPVQMPKNCLDVLAQQIVAMVAVEPWSLDALYHWVRQAFSYADLPRTVFQNLVEMLAGRYPSDAFRDLRPRISWDRVQNLLYPLPGSQHLAITNGGVIPDTGQFGAYLADGQVKLGELEEEFIYETRLGDVIQLGTGKWRVQEILRDRILVQPAPNVPARMPFWKGEFYARSPHLGQLVGQAVQEMTEQPETALLPWLQSEFALDPDAAFNLQEYLSDQKRAVGRLPDLKNLLIEGFFDEIGDLRVAILSPWGARVHLPWRLAIIAQFRRQWGAEPESYHSDVGLLFRMPTENFSDLVRIIQSIDVDNLEELVIEELANSPLFGLRFRQNAHRALLLPSRPGQRMPLWLQRMKARDLLEIVRSYENFPILVETFRECLQDVMAMATLKQILAQIQAGYIQWHSYRRNGPSPFVASLLFEFQAAYQYEYETPKSGGAVQPNIQASLLQELLHPERINLLIDAPALEDLRQRLAGVAPGYQARTPVEWAELLRRLGDLSPEEFQAAYAGDPDTAYAELTATGRIVRFPFPSGERWILNEDLALYTSAFQSSGSSADAARSEILRRYLQNQPMASAADVGARYGLAPDQAGQLLRSLQNQSDVVAFEKDQETVWAYQDNLERLRRTALARDRRAIETISMSAFQNFLLAWQHCLPTTRLTGLESVAAIVEQLQGLYLPYEIWESEVFGRRIVDYQPALLEELVRHGEVLWTGMAESNAETGRIAFLFPDDLPLFQQLRQPTEAGGAGEIAQAIRQVLQQRGASFLPDLAAAVQCKPSQCAQVLWQMIWTGQVSNDAVRVLRAGKPPVLESEPERWPRSYGSRRSYRKIQALHPRGRSAGSAGRWVLLPSVPLEPGLEALEILIWQLLDRYGLICRELLQLETLALRWSTIYDLLSRMEWRGDLRRGYFVEGFSGAQFALPAAVEQMQATLHSGATDEFVLINVCDPANLYGAGLPLPVLHPVEEQWRFLRHPNNYLILHQGRPVLAIEAKGQRLTLVHDLAGPDLTAALARLPDILTDPAGLRRIKSLRIETWNNQPILDSPVVPHLSELGFYTEISSMVLVRPI